MTPEQQLQQHQDCMKLQSHLRSTIQAAWAANLCPETYHDYWSESMCRCLIRQTMTLEQWLRVTPEHIGMSVDPFEDAKAAGKAKKNQWKPWYIPKPVMSEADWVKQRQERQQEQERAKTRAQLRVIHG